MLCAVDLGMADHSEGADGEQAAQIAIALLADNSTHFHGTHVPVEEPSTAS
jgi:hypothetical protein